MAGEVSIYSFQKMAERFAHVRIYLHDINNPVPAATAIRVANIPPDNAFVTLGDVFVFGDLMTEGPNRTSKVLGRAQGIYAAASLARSENALLMAVTFMFTGGPSKVRWLRLKIKKNVQCVVSDWIGRHRKCIISGRVNKSTEEKLTTKPDAWTTDYWNALLFYFESNRFLETSARRKRA